MVNWMEIKSDRSRAGITLVETAVVGGMVAVMIAVTLPALQVAREESRQFQCMDNLKRIGLGVQGYFDAQRTFPPGAVAMVDIQYYGFNYIRWLLPHMGETAMYDLVEKGQYDINGGLLQLNWTLRKGLSGKTLPWLTCPSSSLPVMIEAGDPFNWGLTPNPARFQSLDYSACTGSFHSQHQVQWISDQFKRKGFSGLMPQFYMQGGNSPHTVALGGSKQGKYGVRLREVSDGTSKTIAVVETSGVLYSSGGGITPGRTADTFLIGPCCSDWQPTSHWGTTTILLPVGTASAEAVNSVGGARPITSEHGPAGFVVFADGAVRLLNEDLDLVVLFALADRNDGMILGDLDLP